MPKERKQTKSEIIRLHYAPGTRAVRARWMLEELGIPYELQRVDLRARAHKSADHMRLHPLGKVPALEIDGTALFESQAILLYLADRFWEKDLAPVGEERRARAAYLTWMAFSIGTLEPAIIEQSRVQKAAAQGAALIDMGPAVTAFGDAADVVEQRLTQRPFLLGDTFSAADIMIGSMMIWADKLGYLMDRRRTRQWVEELMLRPAYRRALSN